MPISKIAYTVAMERLYSQIVGTPVITEDAEFVGMVADIIIDPATGKALCFLLPPRAQMGVEPNALIFWHNRLILRDPDDIFELEDVLRFQKIIDGNIPLLNQKVITKNGTYLGRVLDIAFDGRLFVMTKLLVAKSFFGFIHYDEKIIPAKHIIEITSKHILVKDVDGFTSIKSKAKPPQKIKVRAEPAVTA